MDTAYSAKWVDTMSGMEAKSGLELHERSRWLGGREVDELHTWPEQRDNTYCRDDSSSVDNANYRTLNDMRNRRITQTDEAPQFSLKQMIKIFSRTVWKSKLTMTRWVTRTIWSAWITTQAAYWFRFLNTFVKIDGCCFAERGWERVPSIYLCS